MKVKYGRVECKNIQQEIAKLWQNEWEEGNNYRHYFSLKPTVKHTSSARLGRKDSVVVTRLRLRHCAMNYGLAMVDKQIFFFFTEINS